MYTRGTKTITAGLYGSGLHKRRDSLNYRYATYQTERTFDKCQVHCIFACCLKRRQPIIVCHGTVKHLKSMVGAFLTELDPCTTLLLRSPAGSGSICLFVLLLLLRRAHYFHVYFRSDCFPVHWRLSRVGCVGLTVNRCCAAPEQGFLPCYHFKHAMSAHVHAPAAKQHKSLCTNHMIFPYFLKTLKRVLRRARLFF